MKHTERMIWHILDKLIFSGVELTDYNSVASVLKDIEINLVVDWCETHNDVADELFQVYKIHTLTLFSNHTKAGREFRDKYGIK